MEDIQQQIVRAMSPGKKLQVAGELYRMARELKAAGIRMQHPGWNDDEVRSAVRDAFLYGRT